MNMDIPNNVMEHTRLKHDNGADMVFYGRLFAESSWYDEENDVLTRQKLFVTDTQEQVYYIVSGAGNTRSRRAYRLSIQGDKCSIDNGATAMTLEFEMLMLAVRGLCGLDAHATPTLGMVEEMLTAANA